ncbi:STAS domain-containing protein [Allostreptomyces psammosilenae]|uniref:RsbT co-antagonist protein RsbR n=1 Tax=Allostreptomyces psammosilenae TaxID=1892865 RepID=A0A853A0F3_9ACTN|nr:STAS domain-containing protein [Allostreptomyces psammosilenae]NYI06940.1 rsbT co-antagonist protein RsbR [Allostreptomyces psammosilenae]
MPAQESDHIRDRVASVLGAHRAEIVSTWADLQAEYHPHGVGASTEELDQQASDLLDALLGGLAADVPLAEMVERHEPLRGLIVELSARWARYGLPPGSTAAAVLGLKEAVVHVLRAQQTTTDPGKSALHEDFDVVIALDRMINRAGVLVFETFVSSREAVIARQNEQLLELSTPVISLWQGVLAVPLIGTLDTGRTQVVMESLLESIQANAARVAIIDVTGVPTVDTLVAQHLLQTVTAARLMGTECLISGIRPQTAQTMVQLGVDLTGITTRANLADAFVTAVGLVGGTMPTAHTAPLPRPGEGGPA